MNTQNPYQAPAADDEERPPAIRISATEWILAIIAGVWLVFVVGSACVAIVRYWIWPVIEMSL